MATEIKPKCYTCLDPLLLNLLILLVLLVVKGLILITEVAHRLYVLDHQSSSHKQSGLNIDEANKATIRIVHQRYKNSKKSL